MNVKHFVVVVAVVAALLGPVDDAASAGAAGEPRNALYFEGEPGSWTLSGSSLSFSDVRYDGQRGSDILMFSVNEDGHWWHVWFAVPEGQEWAPGVYEGGERADFRADGKPGLEIFGDGRGCNRLTARFIVDEVELDANGDPEVFSARFEHHCEGADPAVFGALSYNSAAPFRSHSIPFGPVQFGSLPLGAVGAPQHIQIGNQGPDPLDVAAAALTGAGASSFDIVADDCSGQTLQFDDWCTISVAFAPVGSQGARSAKLTVFDDLAPVGGTGRDVLLSGTALPYLGATGELTPLTPARILDTRDGTGQGGIVAPLGPKETRVLDVTGVGGVPASEVSAVVLNVTATNPTAPSHLTLSPNGSATPRASNVNFLPGETRSNLVTVGVGDDGGVALRNQAGATDVVIDVVGAYSTSDGLPGARFHGVEPARLLDTRNATGVAGEPAPLGPAGTLALDVTGVGGVPESAVAVVVNVTATGSTEPSHLTVYPADVARPRASNLNYRPGHTVSNLVVTRVPANGVVNLYNHRGSTELVADVMGYFDLDRSTDRGRFIPMVPTRIMDTRSTGSPLPPQSTTVVRPSQHASIPALPGHSGVVMNVTAIAPTANGWLALRPLDVPRNVTSNVNFAAGSTVPTLVMTAVSSQVVGQHPPGSVAVRNASGSTHAAIDVFGYFT